MNISLCIIAKNEEHNIKKCIESVKELVKEIIVVDTGSEDNTVGISKELGAKVYYYKWNKDFAAARNYALKKVKSDWILFLDADEYMSEESKKYIKKVILEADSLKCDCILVELININKDSGIFQSKTNVVRMLKNNSNLKYIGKIHEGIVKNRGRLKRMDGSEVVRIFHTGYTGSVVKEKHKSERNLELLYEELENNPNNSDLYFYLIESLLLKNDLKKAYECCNEIFKCNNGTISGIYEKTYLHKLSIAMNLDEKEDVIVDIYKKSVQINEYYPDFDRKMQLYYYYKKEYEKALDYSKKCIFKMNKYKGDIESWTLPKAKDIYMLTGEIYEKLNLRDESIDIWIQILKSFKDDEYSIFKIMKNFKETETKEDILYFFKRLLDINNPKEKLAIIRAAIRTNDLEFSKYIVEQLKN